MSWMGWWILGSFACCAAAAGCGAAGAGAGAGAAGKSAVEPGGGGAAGDVSPDAGGIELTSPDFEDGQPIPKKHAYEGEGENVPPGLEWSGLPEGTVELALVVDDPDAPGGEPWVHDVLYKIPVDANATSMVVRGAGVMSAPLFFEGKNGWGEPGWGGPKPPVGEVHHYRFTLYALDAALDVLPGLTKDELMAAMEGHVIGTAVLTGTYER